MSTYTLFLKNFIDEFSIGIHDFEKAAKQRIIINIEIEVQKNTFNDDIANVLNYDFLIDGIKKIAASEHINLQETLCERIIEICKTKTEILAINISSQKPDVYENCEGVGCKMKWARN